jgi:predicted GNAT family acetyltransferase
MGWRVTEDIDEFEDAAGAFLVADPVRNTVLLTVMASLRKSGATAYGEAAPWFAWYQDSEVRAAFLRTPPMPALVSDAPDHVLRALVGLLDGVPGLSGPTERLRVFAEAWHAAHGRSAKVVFQCRLFRLDALTPQQPAPPGRARMVADADRELLIEWFTDNSTESGDPERTLERRLANGELLVWEVDGVPVSLAGRTAPIAGVTRIGPVYTPAALRGRGYAGAGTAAVSRRGLDAGHEVVLFTNMANPTSNALYQRLGFRPLGQWSGLELG